MCYQPITIKTPQGYRQVPCGKCLECLRKYQSDWSNRMYEELKSHNGKAVFFTLTYDEDNVPKNYLYDYQIYRSTSDYGYDNTYKDENGKEKVLPSRKGERMHKRISPTKELEDLGLDVSKVIDFNVKRTNHTQFMNSIKKIYGDYLSNLSVTASSMTDSVSSYEYDFDSFDEDYFSIREEVEEVIKDDDYLEVLPSDNYRERPIMMFNSVRKKDVQDWIKRARQRRKREAVKNDQPEQKFTFFVTSEYGPRTLRPHYHGVLFGVTARETMDMCADWQRHHGRKIAWDDVDLSKGDMSYCAKYCSKGFYEHPLCSKDFFYPKPKIIDGVKVRPFTEYHSKHYERCIELFGIDEAIVDPTFHLCSKGLGVSWVEDNKERFTADFKDIDFIDGDAKPTVHFVRDRIEIDLDEPTVVASDEDNLVLFDFYENPGILYDLSITSNLDDRPEYIQRKIYETKTKDYEECISRLFTNFKYYRSFKGENVAYGVPKYYRTKILSDGLRAAFANYVLQTNVDVYKQKLDELRIEYPSWTDAEIVSEMEAQDIRDKYERMFNIRQKLDKQYNKSKI